MLTKDGVPQDNAGHPDLVNQNDGSTFDAIGYSRKLTEAGLPVEVAETMARLAQQDKAEQAQNLAALRVELRDELARRNNDRLEHLATKADVERVRRDLSREITEGHDDLKREMIQANHELKREILQANRELKHETRDLSVEIITNRLRSHPWWALILITLFFSLMNFLIALP